MEKRSVDEIIDGMTYTSLLFGTYKENPVWYRFFEIIDDTFSIFKTKLKQLVTVRVPDKATREINILTASNLGFNIKNSYFTNEEYINLIENLKIYERKKGTKYFMNILGLVKSAHFNVYPLWTSDYKTFERDSVWVQQNSILKDYKRVIDSTFRIISDGYIMDSPTRIIDEGSIKVAANVLERDGIIDENSMQTQLPDITDPDYYTNKYYPTSHVDIDYDVDKFPISEDDIRYLFYKVAPIHLVLNLIDGVIYADSVYLYLALGPVLERSWDTIPTWANYEAYLYYNALYHDTETYNGSFLYYNYTETKDLVENFDKTFPHKFKLVTASKDINTLYTFICNRVTRAFSVNYDNNNYQTVTEHPSNEERYIWGEGILLEKNSINFVEMSSTPGTKTVSIPSGTYTISSVGTNINNNRVYISSNKRNLILELNQSYTFETTGEVITIVVDERCDNVQLEKGSYASSPIITEKIRSRSVDLYYSNNRIKDSRFTLKFRKFDDKLNSFVCSVGASFIDCCNVEFNYIDGKYYIQVKKGTSTGDILLGQVEADLNEFTIISTPNSYDIKTELGELHIDFEVEPVQLRLGSDWRQLNGFNGYLTHLLREKL